MLKAERAFRALPEGTYEAEGYRDDDGFLDEPVLLKVKVTISDGHIHLDPSGSSLQRLSPTICVRPMAKCAIAFVARCLVDDGILVNDRFLNRIVVDGPDGVQTNLQKMENAPIEEVELNYPIRVKRYELITDSCGPGRYRGGMAIRRDFEFPYAECSWTVLSDGRKVAPWGLMGGHDSACARFIFDPEGEHRDLPSKCTIEVPKGGCVRVETPGAGGFGEPQTRDRDAVRRHLRDGKISADSARKNYGLTLAT